MGKPANLSDPQRPHLSNGSEAICNQILVQCFLYAKYYLVSDKDEVGTLV